MLLEVLLGLLALWLLALVAFWLLRPRGVAAGDAVRVLPDTLRLIRTLITDRAVPLDVRITLVVMLVWLISPIDLIPEFIPVLGPIDDLVVAVAAMRYVRRRLGSAELRRRWPGSEAGFDTLTRIVGTGGG
ncbi:MAG TPA: YkvA family protein [Candidatus Limnocylindrales bacterium]